MYIYIYTYLYILSIIKSYIALYIGGWIVSDSLAARPAFSPRLRDDGDDAWLHGHLHIEIPQGPAMGG